MIRTTAAAWRLSGDQSVRFLKYALTGAACRTRAEDDIRQCISSPTSVGFSCQREASPIIFLYVEVLRRTGLSDVQTSEALAFDELDGKYGSMAEKVQTWKTLGLEFGT